MRLSMLLVSGLVVGSTLALATPGMAQTRPNGGGSYNIPWTRGESVGRPTASEYQTRVGRDGARLEQQEQLTIEEAEERYGSDRVAVAEQVQALMDAGQCDEARRVASEAGERSMAIRVRQTCRRRR